MSHPPSTPESIDFATEFGLKIDTLIEWAILNSPRQNPSLNASDFAEIRSQLFKIADAPSNTRNTEPEPADGGAQYISVTAAPWP